MNRGSNPCRGAILFGYKLASQILLTAPPRFLPRTANNSKPFRYTALYTFGAEIPAVRSEPPGSNVGPQKIRYELSGFSVDRVVFVDGTVQRAPQKEPILKPALRGITMKPDEDGRSAIRWVTWRSFFGPAES